MEGQRGIRINHIALVAALTLLLQGCVGSSYKSDFGCKPPKKPQCKSLYEITMEADSGAFGPDSKKDKGNCCDKDKKRLRSQGVCKC